ncbi:hypothetical protein [Streptomyces sp. SYSU K217416]
MSENPRLNRSNLLCAMSVLPFGVPATGNQHPEADTDHEAPNLWTESADRG